MPIAWKYGLLVFCAVMGVLQAAAGHNNLKGLLFFRSKVTAYVFAVLTVGGSLFTFFFWNYMFEIGVIAGTEQAGLFTLASFLAILSTLLISSLIKSRSLKNNSAVSDGLEALREATIFHIIRGKLNSKR